MFDQFRICCLNVLLQIVRKSLDSVLTTVSEDVPIESAKDLIDTSSSCEVLDENQLNGSPEVILA